jgi:hypothetical protein
MTVVAAIQQSIADEDGREDMVQPLASTFASYSSISCSIALSAAG